jgi:hypothetical protein
MLAFSARKIALVAVASFLIGIFASRLALALPENATEAMKSIITADAALIGFIGVITVFLFNSLQNEDRRIDDAERKATENTEYYKRIYQSDENKALAKENLQNLNFLRLQRKLINQFFNRVLIFVVAGVLLLIVSILWALFGMSLTPEYRFYGIILSIATMGAGILILLLLLDYYKEVFGLLRQIKTT